MASATQDLLTKKELEEMDYNHLLTMDKNYSFKTHSKTKSTNMNKDAIIKRLLKHGVKRNKFASELGSYLKYEFEHPIAKSLPSGTFIPPYLVGKIYTMKKELEDRQYELEFLKNIFEPTAIQIRQNISRRVFTSNAQTPFFNFKLDPRDNNSINLNIKNGFKEHVANLYSSDFFIKDYNYLVKKFGLNADKLRQQIQNHTRLQNVSPFGYQEQTIMESEAEHKSRVLTKFFNNHILAAYSMYIVIDKVMYDIEYYRDTHRHIAPHYPQDEANQILEDRYIPPPFGVQNADQNKPINVLKVYIGALNKLLLKLRGYKILLNPNIITDLNKRLNALNEYLVEPDASIANQAYAKFSIRVLENGLALPKKQRSYTPRKKSKSTTQKRVKSL